MAAKVPESVILDEQQKQPTETIPAQGAHETLVVSIEEKDKVEDIIDSEGFTPLVTRRSRKSSRNSFTETSKQEIMYDWMIDDVGTIESSDEEENMTSNKPESDLVEKTDKIIPESVDVGNLKSTDEAE